MSFTTNNTLNEILDSLSDVRTKAYFNLGMPLEFIDLVPDKLRNCSLAEIKEQFIMPWGLPYPAEDVARTANFAEDMVAQKKYGIIPLWEEEQGEFVPDPMENGKKSVFLLTLHKEKNYDKIEMQEKRPAVIICPGGGYETLSFIGEGISMAEKFEASGYFPFILRYRVSPVHYPEPQKDLALAIKYVRANAERYHIAPDRLMLMGSSAGGHLCASMTALYAETEEALLSDLERSVPHLAEKYWGISIRPDRLCLNYPVISFEKEAHEGSFQALTGGDEKLRGKLSVEKHISKDFSKTFVWACEDDQLVSVSNTKRMGEALARQKIPYAVKIYPTGGHGCGLALGTSAEGWFDEMIRFMED
ncbi:MAG TPA: alpha/beta hydrolase [Candidatus Mediterraneibacter excrementigallinarum]|nr:alpha/beta hydrolase [Candidatus Mediterraneibacter excrementigallinarum]